MKVKHIRYQIENFIERIPAPVGGIFLVLLVAGAMFAAVWSTSRTPRGTPEGVIVGKQSTGDRVYEHNIKGHTYLTFGKTIIHAQHCPCHEQN